MLGSRREHRLKPPIIMSRSHLPVRENETETSKQAPWLPHPNHVLHGCSEQISLIYFISLPVAAVFDLLLIKKELRSH